MLRERLKWLFFPGLNLNARLRYKTLPTYFGSPQAGEERLVLDAGCGNGMLAYQAYLMGNKVLGVSIKDEVTRDTLTQARKKYGRWWFASERKRHVIVNNLEVVMIEMQVRAKKNR